MRKLFRYFIQGCLVVGPLAATVYLVLFVVRKLDALVPVGIPLLGVLATVVVLTAVGFFASSVVGRAVVSAGERWLTKVPFVKLVYNSIKDLVSAFVGDRKSFDKPVMVSLIPGSSAKLLGFMTRERVAFVEGHVAVYLPQSYNFAGNVIVCRRDQVEAVDVESADFMAFIVSGGVSPTRREVDLAAERASIPSRAP